ncbi:hypothetical protein AVL55_05050 [Alteromonas macleodii]|uniref:BioF2-like acetyltransferase domain-containing protein n=1 Tax=Alteromonas macleodii TaxID=28108 RepID=A0A126PX57_ALTMA|nr:GNAT family N-acetyltransferase [Alteromonas macleodii]AMJ97583.1 hypothetical protein AVL55_05050 [Alteromonas macleodii]
MYRINIVDKPPVDVLLNDDLRDEVLVFYAAEYAQLVCTYLEAEYKCIIVEADNGDKAFLPLFIKDGPLGRVVNSSAFFGSHGCILCNTSSSDIKLTLLDTLNKWCNENDVISLTLVTNPLLDDLWLYDKFFTADFKDSRIGQFTYFPKNNDSQVLLTQFHSSRRGDYRKAKRNGVEVRYSQNKKDLDWLADVHRQEMNKMGGIAKSQAFFDTLYTTLTPSQWQVLCAESDGEMISALLLLYFNNTVEYFTPVTLPSAKSIQPMAALICEGMVDAMGKGYTKWNWGGTWHSQKGVYEFKRKWGTTDKPYFYFTRLRNKQILHTTAQELLASYPGFYVLPFDELLS